MRARAPGFSAITGALAALLVWAGHFTLIYGAHALACERGFADAALLGLPAVPALVLGASLAALLAVGLVGWRAWRRLDGSLAAEAGEDAPRFLAWLTLATALLAALAILWEAVPVLLLHSCR
ncbi:hypothetical protein [Siccirubricoccus phaeus]|uniref:hypothetical protein n=1 Tax=Siccirubricoccus phaeus TaxID=2595053 RepID=UPI0011F0B573|nr:hypothetical protein [Siccirubricoccus phaeus]